MLATLASYLDAATWVGVGAFVLRLTLIAAAGLGILALTQRAAAALRHQIALATLAALLALPLAAAFLPALPIPVLPSRAPAFLAASSPLSPGTGSSSRALETSHMRIGPPSQMTLDASYGLGIERSTVTSASARPSLPAPATAFLLALLLGSALFLARWLRSILAAAEIARAASPVTDDRLCREFHRAKARLGLGRPVALRSTDRLSVPIVWGVLRPTLLLPVDAHEWSPERQRIVLLHELAHIARHDAVSLMLTRAATAVFWFHPLAWALARYARRECEQACDDVVLASGERASAYAGHLLAIARFAFDRDAVGDVAPAFARHSKLEHRLVAILDPGAARSPATKRTLLAVALAAALVVLPIATAHVVAAPAKAAPTIQLAGSNKGEELFEQAREHYQEERYGEAAEAYIRAAAAGHRVGTALYNAACSLALDGRTNDALVALEQALEAGFDNPELIASDDDLDSLRSDPRFRKLATRAKSADRSEQRVRAAILEYERMRGERSKDDHDWQNLGITLMRLDQFPQAIDSFQHEYELNSDADALYNTACALALSGDRKSGIAMLERAILAGSSSANHILRDDDLRTLRNEPRFDELVDLARDLELNGDLSALGMPWTGKSAIRRYERIVRERPNVGRAWFNLGFVQLKGDDAEGAVESFRKSLELNHRPQTSMYNLACAYAQSRQADEAIEWLERAEASGMKVGKLALGDDDLDPLRSDPRFRKMRDRWDREMRSEQRAKRND